LPHWQLSVDSPADTVVGTAIAMELTSSAQSHSFLWRAVGVALFRSDVYDEVKQDPHGTAQAALIVIAAGILPQASRIIDHPFMIVLFTALAIAFWAFEALVVCTVARIWIAPSLLQGKRTLLLRTLGFAGTPAILAAMLIETSNDQLLTVLIGCWGAIATIFAVRQSLGISTTKAITIGITALVGFIDLIALISVLGLVGVVALIVR
jgi:hypothetical protein